MKLPFQFFKWIKLILGIIFLIIGIIGVVTPIIPTTPFILLSLYFIAQSSPALSNKIKKCSLWEQDVKNWERDKVVSKSTKIKASLIICLSIILIILSGAFLMIKISVITGLILIIIFLWTLFKSKK